MSFLSDNSPRSGLPKRAILECFSYVMLVAIILVGQYGSTEARTLDEIQNSGELRICVAGASKDFYQQNAEAFARYLGVSPRVKRLNSWNEQFQNGIGVVVKDDSYETRLLAQNECDLFPNDIHILDWRQKKMLLIPYYKTSMLAVGYRSLRDVVKTESDFAGRKAVVQKGTSYEAWLLEQNEYASPDKLIRIENSKTDECMKLVAQHKFDFTIVGVEGAFKWIRDNPDDLELLFPVGNFLDVGWGISNASTGLAQVLSAFFKKNMRIGSELDRSWQRQYGISLVNYHYFSASFAKEKEKRNIILICTGLFICVMICILLTILYWTKRLRLEIARRHIVETALRESETFSRAIVENSPICIIMLNSKGEMTYISPGGLQLLEIEDAQAYLGTPCIRFGDGVDATGFEMAMREAREGRIGTYQGFYITQKGKPKWLDVSIVSLCASDAAIGSYLVLSRDVTVQKLSGDALRESEERFRHLVENAPDAIVVHTGGKFSYVNKASLKLYGTHTPEYMLGMPVLSRVHPNHHVLAGKSNFQSFESCEALQPIEQRHLRLDGTPIDVEISSIPVKWEGENAALLFVRDISTRKNMELLREEMDQITRHDLKSPLAGILGASQLLMRDKDISGDQRELLHMLLEAGYRMLHMINLSLDLYRMEQGIYELSPVRINILLVVRSILSELNPLANDKRVRFQVQAKGADGTDVEDCPSMAEELLCYSMLSNLIKNALESSPTDSQVSICLCAGPECHISIHNLGEVPKQIRSRFFEKFATAGKRGGTGIGTYSARLMATTMGGGIKLDTSESGATSVIVLLPGQRVKA